MAGELLGTSLRRHRGLGRARQAVAATEVPGQPFRQGGLCESPLDWPGVHCARALVHGEKLEGYWFHRSKEWTAQRRGQIYGTYDYATRYLVGFAQLPAFRALSAEAYQNRVAELIREIEVEGEAARQGNSVAGMEKILSQDPYEPPTLRPKRSARPLYHAASREAQGLRGPTRHISRPLLACFGSVAKRPGPRRRLRLSARMLSTGVGFRRRSAVATTAVAADAATGDGWQQDRRTRGDPDRRDSSACSPNGGASTCVATRSRPALLRLFVRCRDGEARQAVSARPGGGLP